MALSTFFKWAGGGVVAVIALLCLLLQGAYWYGASLLPKELPQPRREYPALARETLWRTLGGGDAPISARRLNAFSYASLIFESLVPVYLTRGGESLAMPADLELVERASSATRGAIDDARRARIPSPPPTPGGSNAEALQQISSDLVFESSALFIRTSREWPAERMADIVLDHGGYGRGSENLEQAARAYFGADVGELTRDELLSLMTLRYRVVPMDPYCQPEQFRERYTERIKYVSASGLPSATALSLPRLKPIDCTRPQ
ncbi:transglycosylase domain-containing protein [Lysobacter sp. K5869]|uniref:transglycosylase domain-containing protein n=1 Tax=Lysobacter sp. K5869 TaxID=2820808 RepID=UPI001C061D79|nr:transglycosylase domain-containing protein [Lysobacter sp. K5869]QWP74642.1 transglycosylase domain-containing protein [Lysobacter sp. K5869]